MRGGGPAPWVLAALLVACGGGSGGGAERDGGEGELDAAPSGDGGVDAAGPPDAGPTRGSCDPGDALCDPITQAGCGADEACYADGAETRCASRGVLGAGTSCLRDRDCQPGLFCFGEGERGSCTRYCCPSARPACAPDQSCLAFAGVHWGACVASCDARAQEGCAEGEACVPIDGAGGTACVAPGEGREGDACDRVGACEAGLGCLAREDEAPRCVRLCATDDDCAGGEVCRTLAGTVSVCEPA